MLEAAITLSSLPMLWRQPAGSVSSELLPLCSLHTPLHSAICRLLLSLGPPDLPASGDLCGALRPGLLRPHLLVSQTLQGWSLHPVHPMLRPPASKWGTEEMQRPRFTPGTLPKGGLLPSELCGHPGSQTSISPEQEAPGSLRNHGSGVHGRWGGWQNLPFLTS